MNEVQIITILRLGYTVRERDRDQYRDQMTSTVHCRNVHTGTGKGPGPIVFYCASPIPRTGPSPIPVQYDYTISLLHKNGKDLNYRGWMRIPCTPLPTERVHGLCAWCLIP